MRLAGRVGVVTGAGRGLGAEIARGLATEGMALLLLARTGAQVRALAAELEAARVLPVALDVTDAAAVGRAVMHAEQQLGPIDLLVNNAAVIERAPTPFWETDPQEMWDVVETNLRGPLLLTRAVLPAMVQRGHGHVVNVTSLARAAARTGGYTAYAVSKGGLSVLTQTLAGALNGTGVVVVDLLPGLVRTTMTARMPVWAEVPEHGWDSPSSAVATVVDVALGRHDDAAGTALDAPALTRAKGAP